MNTNTSLFFARDHAAELFGEAQRERLARQAQESRPVATVKPARRSIIRWPFLTSLRSSAESR